MRMGAGKASSENPVLGRKSATRRVHLAQMAVHHRLRAERRTSYRLYPDHARAIEDLMTLSVSHYSQVRDYAQVTLNR